MGKSNDKQLKELIHVRFDTDEPSISARELHSALEIKYDFKRWVDHNFKQFIDGVDYHRGHMNVMANKYGGSQEILDYTISVNMAQHLCLMSQTEKGKQCRQYLIDLEKAWNTPEQVMARALKLADKTIEGLTAQNRALLADNERMKPKEIFHDAVAGSKSSIPIGDLAKILKQNGIDIGANRMFKWMRENGFLIKRKGRDWNIPTQKSMNAGLFEVKECAIPAPPYVGRTTLVTGFGQTYFIKKFLGESNSAATTSGAPVLN